MNINYYKNKSLNDINFNSNYLTKEEKIFIRKNDIKLYTLLNTRKYNLKNNKNYKITKYDLYKEIKQLMAIDDTIFTYNIKSSNNIKVNIENILQIIQEDKKFNINNLDKHERIYIHKNEIKLYNLLSKRYSNSIKNKII